ncbi:uncharacterized protein LOC111034968 isoform X2 [Myzus persicae]|uniref:uncharacterized protein LOC111034968 isoform X2 n=1 Tax=Myzus persicae TaxID=13164 RepID=UPI000B932C8E|nr:uncharacterized protein LOC111034968 isoform X2 [Myzus persicae]
MDKSKKKKSPSLKVSTMDKSKKKKSTGLKETNKLLKPEQRFIGFDNDDELLIIIENKKKLLKMEIIKESGEPMDVKDPSIVKNNHVNKKRRQSKSSISSPKSHVVKNNQSNKRPKKYNLRSNTLDSLDFKVPSTSEICNPTFNLTSSKTRKVPRRGRKINVDISDAIYKLPLEHGWRRELVYRKSSKSTILNGTDRSGAVYYYSPSNQKLRSLRKIREQLDISADKDLTIENFTFLKQPIGMNDRTKELIRVANSKLSKEDSFFGVRPIKFETPVQQPPFDYELSDAENNKSSNKIKNAKSSPTLRSKEGNSYTPEYTSEDGPAIKLEPNVSSSKLENIDVNDTTNKKWNSEINGSLRGKMLTSFAPMQSVHYMVKALGHIFKHLNTRELLSASRVCTTWHLIAMNNLLWQNVRLENFMVYDWERFVDFIDQQRTGSLDTSCMLIPVQVEEFKSFWSRFSIAIKRAQKLKFIELSKCPTHVVEDIIYSLPQIEVLNATSIKNPHVPKRTKNFNDPMLLNLINLGQMTNLTELRLKGLTGIKITSMPSFQNLTQLNKFSLTSIESFPKDFCQIFETITDKIEFLEIGDCNCLSKNFAVSLKKFVNLKSLRLENLCDLRETFVHDVLTVIRSLEKLNVLELINIRFTNCVKDELEKCDSIKALLIIPVYGTKCASVNSNLIDCFEKLSNTLTHLGWGITHEFLRVTDMFLTQFKQNRHMDDNNLESFPIDETTNYIPILGTRKPSQQSGDEPAPEKEKKKVNSDKDITMLTVPNLEKMLDTMMPNAKTRVIKVPFSRTVRTYLRDQFNDL